MRDINYIIDSDPTLKFLIKDAHIDIWNSHQLNVRFKALQLALFKQIDEFSYENQNLIHKFITQ